MKQHHRLLERDGLADFELQPATEGGDEMPVGGDKRHVYLAERSQQHALTKEQNKGCAVLNPLSLR